MSDHYPSCRLYSLTGIVKPRGVRVADYGTRYDSTYRNYEFRDRESAERFIKACGYTPAGTRPSDGTIGGAYPVNYEGTVTVYLDAKGRKAELEDVEIW